MYQYASVGNNTEVCPWNQDISLSEESRFQARPESCAPNFLRLYVEIAQRCFFLFSLRSLPANNPKGDFAILPLQRCSLLAINYDVCNLEVSFIRVFRFGPDSQCFVKKL